MLLEQNEDYLGYIKNEAEAIIKENLNKLINGTIFCYNVHFLLKYMIRKSVFIIINNRSRYIKAIRIHGSWNNYNKKSCSRKIT